MDNQWLRREVNSGPSPEPETKLVLSVSGLKGSLGERGTWDWSIPSLEVCYLGQRKQKLCTRVLNTSKTEQCFSTVLSQMLQARHLASPTSLQCTGYPHHVFQGKTSLAHRKVLDPALEWHLLRQSQTLHLKCKRTVGVLLAQVLTALHPC